MFILVQPFVVNSGGMLKRIRRPVAERDLAGRFLLHSSENSKFGLAATNANGSLNDSNVELRHLWTPHASTVDCCLQPFPAKPLL